MVVTGDGMISGLASTSCGRCDRLMWVVDMPRKNAKERASKKLVELLGKHLSRFSASQQNEMHDKFERRLANHRDSEAKKPSPLRAEIR